MSFRKDNAAAQTRFRLAVLENGYTPLPNHHKHCYLKGWNKVEPSVDMIHDWERKLVYQATGLRVENGLCALDMDIDDADMVASIWDQCISQFPQLREALIRFGKGAKEMWVCRTDEPFSVIFSTGHVKPGEDPESEGVVMNRMEAFGGGHPRQIGAFGAHTMRKDGKGFEVEYEWADDESPADVRLDALPLLPKAAVMTIATIVSDALTKAEWPRVRRTKKGESTLAAVYDLTPDMRFDCLDGVTRSLDQLADYASSDKNARCSASWMGDPLYVNRTRCLISLDHDDVITVLETANWTRHMPVGASVRERPLADRHTDLAAAMADAGFEFDYDTYHDAPSHFERRVMDLLHDWAWCGSRADPCLPIYRPETLSMSLNNLRMTNLSYSYEREGERGGVRKINPVDAWVGHTQRQDVDGYRFMPDRGPGVYETDDNLIAINSYVAPRYTPASDEEHVAFVTLWLDFMRHLLPNHDEREWFLDWLAHKKQNPCVPGVGVIMFAGEYGVGRGSLFEILGGVFGDRYVNNVSADTLMGATSQSQYTDWLADTLIVTTDEVLPEGDDGVAMTWRRKKAYEKLKERIDPKPRRMEIVRKSLPNYQDWVYASFLLATNHNNAVPIPVGDRRLTVLTNSIVPLAKRPELMERLNSIRNPVLVPEFVSSVARWLDERDVSGFNMHVAPAFEGKTEMQEANVSELENIVDGVLDSMPYDWSALDVLLSHVEAALIQQNLRDDFPQWRKTATDRIKTRWLPGGRTYMDAARTKKSMLVARSRAALAACRALDPRERGEYIAEMRNLNRQPSAKARALRAGLREV